MVESELEEEEEEEEEEVISNEIPPKRQPWWKRRWMVVVLVMSLVLSGGFGWGYWNGMKDKQAIEYLEGRGYEVRMVQTGLLGDFGGWVKSVTGIDLPLGWHVDGIINGKLVPPRAKPKPVPPPAKTGGNFRNVLFSTTTKIVRFVDIEPEDWPAIRRFRHLTLLELRSNQVSDKDIVNLRDFKELKQLDLFSSSITDAALVHLTSLTNLKKLDVRVTKITREKVQELLPWVQEVLVTAPATR